MILCAEPPKIATENAGRRLAVLPAPEPVPDQAAYVANRERALAADPRKRVNHELFLRVGRVAAAVPYRAVKLDIENVSRCNLACTMGLGSEWPKRRRARDMTPEEFRRLIDEQIGLVEIKLQGIGEPTLQGDAFFGMIRYARARHIWVRTTTNGTLLHLNHNARKLADLGVNEIQISIDGPDAEVYESIRRGVVFDRVARNVVALNAYCAETDRILTKMWTVVQAANADRLPDFVRLAAALGFRRQVFSLELSDWASDSWNVKNGQVDVLRDLDPAALHDLASLSDSLGFKSGFGACSRGTASPRPSACVPGRSSAPISRRTIGSCRADMSAIRTSSRSTTGRSRISTRFGTVRR